MDLVVITLPAAHAGAERPVPAHVVGRGPHRTSGRDQDRRQDKGIGWIRLDVQPPI
jgi:hypothetical protein